MQQISSSGADLSEREIAQVIEQAKVARVRFLFGPQGRGLKAIGLSSLACVVAFLVVAGAGSGRHQAFENTVIIERLATRLAHADTISPETAGEISQLLRRRDYDCRQLACDAQLEKRNLAARNRLQAILTRTALQADAAGR
jgi:homoserine kinase